MSSTEARCVSPSGVAGSSLLSFAFIHSSELGDFGGHLSTRLVFVHTALMDIRAVTPAFGDAMGGSSVGIHAAGLRDGVAGFCRFAGRVTVLAEKVHADRMVCRSPAYLIGNTTVETSSNNADFSIAHGFGFIARTNVTAVNPVSTSANGGVSVSVTGFGFLPRMYCGVARSALEGPAWGLAPATVVSSTVLRCMLPHRPSGMHSVEVAHTPSNEISRGGASVEFRATTKLVDVFPSSGPAVGGTVVTINGNGFVAAHTACVFGSTAVVEAVVLSSTEVTCVVPPGVLGISSVHTSNIYHGQVLSPAALSANGLTFQRVSTPVIKSILPTFGQAQGGTVVSVQALGIYGAHTPVCRFAGRIYTNALSTKNAAVQCISSADVVGNTTVELSLNGQDFAPTIGFLDLMPSMNVSSATPRYTDTLGSHSVLLHGVGFPRTVIHCGLAGSSNEGSTWTTSLSQRVSASIVSCPLPARGGGFRSVEASLSSDGQMTRSGVQVEYVPAPRVLSVYPSTGRTQGGTVVTITGTGLAQGRTGCRFGSGQLVVADVRSDEEATCVTTASTVGVAKVLLTTSYDFANPVGAHALSDSGLTFTYSSALVANTLTPTTAGVNGGTSLQLGTYGLYGVPRFCRFNGVVVVAISQHHSGGFACTTPALRAGNASVEISASTGEFDRSDVNFESVVMANITGASPAILPVTDGSRVQLVSSGLTSRMSIYMGTSVMQAYRSTHSAAATLFSYPGSAAGYVSMGVSASITSSPQRLAWSTATVERKEVMRVIALTPSAAPNTGGTIVTITGQNFAMRNPVCRFGTVTVLAAAASSTEVHCHVPSAMQGLTTLDVVDDGNTDAPLAVSASGNFVAFKPSTGSATPASSSQDGGSVVKVFTKANMPRDMQCRFNGINGVVTVSGLRVSPNELRCITPAHAPDNVTLEVLADAHDSVLARMPYVYHTRLNVTTFLPNSGPVTGGTRVLVSGSHYLTQPLGSAICQFGVDRVSAEQITPSRMACSSPPHAAGFAPVRISNEPGDYDFAASDRLVQFEYQEVAVVTSVFPRNAPNKGESVVTISGANFVDGNAHCMFGAAAPSAATVVSATELRCMAPAAVRGIVSITVSNSFVGQVYSQADFTTTAADFIYTGGVPTISSMRPLYGMQTGGTTVTLTGQNFAHYDAGLFCKFGNTITVRASPISHNNVTCAVPAGTEGNVTVEVTNNHHTYSSSYLTFERQGGINVTALTPMRGVVSGGTIVQVAADGLSSRSAPALNMDLPTDIWCRFGKRSVEARFDKLAMNQVYYGLFERPVTPTSVRCRSDAHGAGWVTLEMSNNRIDFSDSGIQFEFSEAPVVHAVQPTGGSAKWGSLVTVTGAGFRAERDVHCRFGAVAVKAEVMSSVSLVCKAPRNPLGSVDVTVTNLDVDLTSGYSAPHVRYTYIADPSVMSVKQAVGALAGGTSLALLGARMDGLAQGHFCVFEGRIRVAASMQNGTQMSCIAPAHAAGNVSVSIMTNGDTVYRTRFEFEYVKLHNISSAAPSNLLATGGSILTLQGAGLVSRISSQAFCRFDLAFAKASVLSSTAIACVSPMIAAGFRSVDVTFSPDKYDVVSGSNVVVQHTKRLSVSSLQPTHGFASGGTTVTLTGANFEPKNLYVRFGSMPLVPAQYVSATELHVVAPAAVFGTYAVSVVNNFDGQTLNSADFVGSELVKFTYAHSKGLVVQRVRPAAVDRLGGTLVSVMVPGVLEGTSATCRFGGRVNVASQQGVSEGIVQCVAPAITLGRGNVTVEVSTNGIDFMPSMQSVSVNGVVNVTSIAPHFLPAAALSKVTVTGIGLPASALTHCALGGSAPEGVSWQHNPAIRTSSTSLSCSVRTRGAGMMALEVSTGQYGDVSRSGVQVELVNVARVDAVWPSAGSSAGGSLVTVSGAGFIAGRSACVFASTVVPAQVLSAVELQCVAPAKPVGSVSVEISTVHTGQALAVSDYSQDGQQFAFTAPQNSSLTGPQFGELNGGSSITTLVHGVRSGDAGTCLFGDRVYVQATEVRAGSVTCKSVAGVAGNTTLAISTNARDFTVVAAEVTLVAENNVTSVFPTMAPVLGGSRVQVSLSKPAPHGTFCGVSASLMDELKWSFSSHAAMVSGTSARCVLPPRAGGMRVVEVASSAGGRTTHSGVQVEFVQAAKVLQVSPSTGTIAGGSVVTLSGAGFIAGSTACSFGTQLTGATVRSSTEALCVAPAMMRGSASVEVSTHWQGQALPASELSRGGLTFIAAEEPALIRVSPSSSSSAGGAAVSLVLRGGSTPVVTCLFGGRVFTAAVVTRENAVHCITPAHVAANTSIQVSANGVDFSDVSAYSFSFMRAANISQVLPRTLPLGYTSPVMIHGSRLITGTVCAMGGHLAGDAHWHQTRAAVLASSASCKVSGGASGFRVLEVSSNRGSEYTHSGLQVEFRPLARVLGVTPVQAAQIGGTVVTVTGANFAAGHTMCQFGRAAATVADVQSSTEALCVAPSYGVGTVTLRLAMRSSVDAALTEGDFSTDVSTFQYTRIVKVGTAQPATALATGGSSVTVNVPNARRAAYAVCRTGVVETRAASDHGVVTCKLPASKIGNVTLAVSLNGVDFSSTTIQYVTGVNITHTLPSVVSLRRSTPAVHVFGNGFTAGQNVFCGVGGMALQGASWEYTRGRSLTASMTSCVLPSRGGAFRSVEVAASKGGEMGRSSVQLEYVVGAAVTSVSPSAGVVSGGTVVTLSGSGFVAQRTTCRFGRSMHITAQVVSWTEARCVAPASTAGIVHVEVSSSNSLQLSEDAQRFQFQRPVAVKTVQPSTGAAHGGSLVTVRAAGLRATSKALCQFDGTVVIRPLRVFPGGVECLSPAGIVGNATVQISANDGADFTAPLVAWGRLASVNVTAVHPRVVAMSGGSVATVRGIGLSAANTFCVVAGSSLDSSPWATSPTSVINAATVRCSLPARTAGMRPLEISLGKNTQLSHGGIQLEYVVEGRIQAISPSSGPATSGVVITVSGHDFVEQRTACRFSGVTVVVAEVLSESEARCTVPLRPPGAVSVEVTTSYEADELNKPVFTGRTVYVAYSPRITAVAFTPQSGAVTGGTMVTASIAFARDGKPVICRFGSVFVTSTPIANGKAKCQSVAGLTGNVTLATSMNGQDFTGTPVLFTRFAAPNVTAVMPQVLSSAGGYNVQIFGTGFSRWQQMFCGVSHTLREGSEWSHTVAKVSSESQLSCVMPSRPAGFRNVEVSLIPHGKVTGSGVQVEYAAVGSLDSLAPSSGASTGGTVVTLSGSSFVQGRVACRFGINAAAVAQVVSSVEARCVTPAGLLGKVTVDISTSWDAELMPYFKTVGTNSMFAHAPTLAVKHFQPEKGLAQGGALVTVTVANLPDGDTTTCRFGDRVFVESSMAQNGKVQCAVPAFESGNHTVAVSVNRQDFVALGNMWQAIAAANVTQVTPTLVPNRGEMRVAVAGSGFHAMPVMRCAVGGSSMEGTWQHASSVFSTSSALSCSIPARASGFRALELSQMDAISMTRSGVQLEFVAEASVVNLQPSRGFMYGGSVVTVSGSNFVEGQTACIFGSTTPVVATVASSTELTCVAPPDFKGEALFEVSANYQGQMLTESQMSRSGRVFVYDGSTDMVQLAPRTVPVEGSTVRLTMSHLPAGAAPVCVFNGRVFVDALMTKEGHVECGAPAHVAGNVSVAVSSNGVDFVGAALDVLFEEIVNVTDTRLVSRVPVVGGAQVAIAGRGFALFPRKVQCSVSGANIIGAAGGVFAPGQAMTGTTTDASAPSRVESSSLLSCAMPARGAGFRAVEITMNEGKDFSRSGIQFEFVAPLVDALDVQHAPQHGGVVVTVYGRGFREGMSACAFGTEVVHADVVSTGEMRCVTPSAAVGVVSLEVTVSHDLRVATSQYEAVIDNLLPYQSALYSKSGFEFTFVPAPAYTLNPRTVSGTVAGGTTLTLTPKVAKPLAPTQCKFLNVYVSADVDQNGNIKCVAPAAREIRNVTIAVVYNGQELLVGGQSYEYTTEHNTTGWGSIRRDGSNTYTPMTIEPAVASVRGGFTLKVKAPQPVSFMLLAQRARARFGTHVVSVRAVHEMPGRGQKTLQSHLTDAAKDVVLHAIAPPMAAGFASVEFSYNGEQFSQHGRQLQYLESARVFSLFPTVGVPSQQTVVTVAGAHFREASSFCRFGRHVPTPAEYVSSEQVLCRAPAAQFGPMSVTVVTASVEADGTLQFSESIASDMQRFTFVRPPAIHSIARNAGPQSGGSVINIRGTRFLDSSAQYCRIGESVIVPALRQGAGRVRCYTPAHYTDAIVTVNGVTSHVSRPALNVTVELSFNGVDFTNQGHLFEYQRDVNITSLYPSKGPISGGTLITVSGSNFIKHTARSGYFGCRFGGINVPATYVDSSSLRCLSPASPAAFRDVEVTTNSLFTHSGLQFEQQAQSVANSVWPSRGPVSGGTLVTIGGSNFNSRTAASHLPNTMCRFGAVRSPATVISTNMMVCRAPEMVAGRTFVTVSINNEDQSLNPLDYSRLSTTFDALADVNIASFHPKSGPHTGGTMISVTGSGFVDGPDLMCKLGGVTTRAMYSNETMVVCETASHITGLVPVEISNNAKDFTVGPPFVIYTSPNTTSIYPRKALTFGGTPIFATGSGFTNTTDLKCKFDKHEKAQVVEATFLSSSLVICTAPTHSRAMVTVEVSNNGVDFTNNYQLFEYMRCPIGHYCPDFEVIPSPNGTFCPTVDMRNFTLCFPGTYQPAAGQQSCLPCPVGFICPDYGMFAPLICPRGQVCEEPGLAVGGELKPCPPGYFCPEGTSTADPTGYSDTDRPIPCPEGTYCNFGVVTDKSEALNLTTPQKCFSGFYCPRGSRTPQGAGECPPGYYCPEAIAIACPPGTFCKGFGNSQPKECQPGTYNPIPAQAECQQSEPGTISPGFGRLTATPCPAGFVCNTTGGALPASRCPKGFFCLIGTLTSNASSPEGGTMEEAIKSWSSRRPYPCPPGTYCLDGVKTPYSVKGDLVTPQPCTPGAFCVNATKDATGETCGRYEYASPEDFAKQTWTTVTPRPDGTSEIETVIDDECGGPCPRGHYCPINSSLPTPAPQGTFSKGFGNVQATLCFAGKFAPNRGASECLPCPAGYQCPKDGVWQPTICEPGKYRSLEDTITCQMCPPGTWSAKYGVTDQTFCEACPAGRVCSLEAMTSLAQSSACPQGFVCDTYTFQATAQCKRGYWCDYGTTPARQFDHLCPKGYYCVDGTAKNQRFRNSCPQNYYCPEGTASHQPQDTKCPKGTKSNQGSFVLENCTRVCDDPDSYPIKLKYPCTPTGPHCGCLVNIMNPIHPNSTAKSNSTTSTLFRLEGLHLAKFTLDLSKLEKSMRYGDHWRVSMYVNGTYRPFPHTKWWNDKSMQTHRHQVNDFSFFTRTAKTTIKIQLELLHGLYEKFIDGTVAWQFNDTLTAEIFRPHRANYGQTKTFVALVENSEDNALPQNTPKRWGDQIAGGLFDERRENLGYFNFLATNTSTPMVLDKFNEDTATPELFWNKQMGGAKLVPLPYLPYFSQCRGYGSQIPIFELMENRFGCELVDPSATIPIYKWNPMQMEAVADSCNFTFTCGYEEKLDTVDVRARWFELDADETLFTLTADAFRYDDIEAGPDDFESFLGTTSAVPVNIDLPGSPGQFPRSVSMSVGFFQYSQYDKRLIEASISYEDFEPINKTRLIDENGNPLAAFADGTLDYSFTMETSAMGFAMLINAFAFEVDFFLILFFFIAFGSVGIVSLFWSVQRLCTRLAHPPKFRFWAYIRVLAPNPFKGIFLTVCLASAAIVMVLLLFRSYGLPFLDSWQITYDGKDELGDGDIILRNRAGRTGLAFVVLGFIMMWEGTKAFIPLPNFDDLENNNEDEEEEIFDDLDSSSEEDEEEEIPTDDDLLPEEMRRSHLMFAAIMEMGFLLIVIEFSYSNLFGEEIWTCLVCLKIIQMFFEQLLCNYIKDVLLLCPLMVGLEMTQFVVTMGADGFIDFLMSYCVELVLVLAERVYLDPALKAVGSVFPHISVFFQRRYIEIRQKIMDPEGLEDMEEVPDPEEPEENVIEDLIDAFQVYANETTAVCLAPFLILWMLVFSKELALVDTYGIRDSDLVYYVLFAIVIVPTQMAMDVFIQNSQELFHGWKVYEYLRYAQQRFVNRTERWKLTESEQDESIDKNLRACDQLCFSTQFYFINSLHSLGIVFVAFAIEMMIIAKYNMFADPMFAATTVYIIASCTGIKFVALQIADFVGLWVVLKRPEEEVSALASSLKASGASGMGSGSAGSMSGSGSKRSRSRGGGDAGGVTVRMKSPDLMHAFLEQNRPWMLQNLANIFTSEFLARNPPWIVRELARVFGVTPGMGGATIEEEDAPLGKTTVAADISSDEGSDQSEEAADFGKMDHLLTNAVHKVALRWLSYVRKEETGKYDISSDSDSDEEDGQFEAALLTDATRDVAEAWLRKVAKFLRDERTKGGKQNLQAEISSDSSDESDGEFGMMETLNEVTTQIAMLWLEKIRGKAPPRTEAGLRADISSDDSGSEDENVQDIDYEDAELNEKTTQIAFRWLRSVRSKRRPLQRVDISSDSSDEEDGIGGGGADISSDDSDDDDGQAAGNNDELQVPSTKAIAFKWLRRVRKVEAKPAWEDETEVVEDVALRPRMERAKPKGKPGRK
jgi:hypothetical protein